MAKSDPSNVGKVYLVGAGPGDAGLITLRGLGCLQAADVVLYDYLVNPEIVEHAPASAERICLGQHGRTRIWTQSEINERLVKEARAGKTVVRLKGGDPAVFARGAEEAEYLAGHGIPMEIVPGITASLAAGSYAGIPLTHRDLASAVALITGQEQPDKEGTKLDFEALARFPGTLVVYMGVTTSSRWGSALIKAGKSPETPVAIIRRCSFPDQQVVLCTLREVADRLTPYSRFPPPVIVIIGEVVQVRQTLSWFEQRPLFGTRVLVTRPAGQMDALCGPLIALGAEVLRQPVITISKPGDWAAVDRAIARLDQFDWLVFSSANGVRFFLDRLATTGRDLRVLGRIRLAAIGPGTCRELSRYRLRADVKPAEYRAESLAAALRADAKGRRLLLVRASRGRDVLAQELRLAGGHVEQVVAYQSDDVTQPDAMIRDKLAQGKIDWITVTSSAIARSLVRLFGTELRASRLVSISPVTSGTLRELGFEPAAEAASYTMSGVVEAIVQATAH
jgi:uroporphyrinogen III methyltransferase/synthase